MRTLRQDVFIAERFDDHIKLTNEVLLSIEDEDIVPFIYRTAGSSGRYFRLKGKHGHWQTDTSLHKVIASRLGVDPSLIVDHINNNKKDNRRSNLQGVTTRTNSTKNRTGTSKYYRVSWHAKSGKWRIAFHVDQGVIETFGHFKDQDEAAFWSDVYAIRFLADPVLLNFPDNGQLYLEEALLVDTKRPWYREIPNLEKLYEPTQKAS